MSRELDKYLRTRRAERRGDRAIEAAPVDPVGCFPMSAIDALEAELADKLAQPPVRDFAKDYHRDLWRRDALRSIGHVKLGRMVDGRPVSVVSAEKFVPVGFDTRLDFDSGSIRYVAPTSSERDSPAPRPEAVTGENNNPK